MGKKIWVKKSLGKQILGQEHFWQKMFFSKKKIRVGLTQWGGCITPPPSPKIVGLKLRWVVVSIATRCCITNYRPLGPFFLVELE